MTTTLALASRLRAMRDDDLLAGLHARSYRRAGVSDFFDLAEALLDADAVQEALLRLDRIELAALVALGRADVPLGPGAVAETLRGHAATAEVPRERVEAAVALLTDRLLVQPADEGAPGDAAVAPYDAVIARLEAWEAGGLPSPDALLDTAPPDPDPAADATREAGDRAAGDRLAAERAFEAVTAVSELLAELSREGARELQKGGLALPAAKRLAEALAVDQAAVPVVMSVASRAGLIAIEDAAWLPTEGARGWLRGATPERWQRLADAWLATLPGDVRTLLEAHAADRWGAALREHAAWLHPGSPREAQQRLDARLRDALWLGLATTDAAPGGPTGAARTAPSRDLTPSTPGTALLRDGSDAARAALAPLFPGEVDRVYLQHDLTIVSPGPLAPAIESRLRGMADIESRALASTFRLSPASVDRALTAGETAEGIRAFLTEISLTGLPQPIEYVITDAADRHGRVRVRDATGDGVRSAVRSPDATLLRTIEVDQSLAALRLVRSGESLVSRFARDVVFWALADARYPVLAEDAAGRPVPLRRNRVAHPRPASGRDQDAELIARLREHGSAGGDDAGEWLARQLDQAVRARQTVVVQVAMPDGRTLDLVLEPTGVGGGRLRGRDRTADVERTVPLSSVRGVRPAD